MNFPVKTKLLLGVTLWLGLGVGAQTPPPSPFSPLGFPGLTNTTPVTSNLNRGLPPRFGTPGSVVPPAPPTVPVVTPDFPPPPVDPTPPGLPVAPPSFPAFPKSETPPPFTLPPTVAVDASPSPVAPPNFTPPTPTLPVPPAAARRPMGTPLAPGAAAAFPGAPGSPGLVFPKTNAPATALSPATTVIPQPTQFQSLQTVPPGTGALPLPNRAQPGTPQPPLVVAQPVPPPGAPGAPNAAALDKPIDISTFKFQEMPLSEVLETYAEITGKTVLRAPNVALTTPITLKVQGELTTKEAIEALDTVLALNGVTMVAMGTKFVKAVPFAQAQQEAQAFAAMNLKTDDMPEAARYMTRILQLKSAKPSEIVPAIQGFAKLPNSILPVDSTQILILRDYSENIKRMMEVIEKIDVVIKIDEEFEVIPIKYALASDMSGVLGSLTGGGGGGGTTGRAAGSTSRRTSLPSGVGGTAGGTGSLAGLPGGGGQPGQPNYNPNAGNTTPGASANTLQARLSQIVNRAASGAAGGAQPYLGDARILPYERGNSLLVLANKADMDKVKEVIAKLDVVQQQVLIEAIIIDVNLSDNSSLGVSVGQRPANQGKLVGGGVANNDNGLLTSGTQLLSKLGFSSSNAAAVFPTTGGLSYFGRLGPVFDVAVTALASDSRVNILSRPRIQATHAEQATLFIGETVPYVTGTFFGGISGAGSQSQYQQLAVGISLNVLPLINPDGLVILEIAQNIEQIGGSVLINGTDVPKTTRRQAQTKVAVNNGDTIVLGGFISSTKERSQSGVPVLKDIPFLGALFRTKSEKMSRSELMVLIRPTVLATPSAAAQYTSSERNSLPGVRQAEYEFMKDELARRDKLDKFRKGKADFDTPLIAPGPSAQGTQSPQFQPQSQSQQLQQLQQQLQQQTLQLQQLQQQQPVPPPQ